MTSGAGAPANYRLTEEQELLRATVRRLAEERIAPRAAEIDRTAEFPWDVKELLAEHEILAIAYPAEHGGLGGDLLTLCLAIEELSRVCATTGLILAVQALGSLPLQLAGSEEQKARWLPDLAAGRRLVAFAMTEPEAGSDPAAMRMRASRDGDGYRLDGTKRFISQGGVADLYAVFAVTDPAVRRGHGISCFMVDADALGFSVARLEHKMGIRGSTTAELVFDGVRVGADRLVGAEGEGFGIGLRTLDRSRPGIAAQAVGIAQGATEVAIRHAAQRVQFGRPIAEHQMVAAMLADMATRTEAARQLLYRACVEIEAGGREATLYAAMCKLFAGDTAMAVTTDAVQVLGGYGYTVDYPVERMMRDAKVTQLYEGTQQIQRLVIARELLARLP